MATATSSKRSGFSLRPSGRFGCIGIDIGTTTIKVAQVERVGSRHQMSACQLLPVTVTTAEDDDDRPVWPLKAIQSYRSTHVAATLPRNVVVFRTLQLPFGTDFELRQLVDQELIETSDDEQVFDFWTNHSESKVRPSTTQEVFVTSLDKEVANQFGRDLMSVGLTCKVIDATPFAVARAISMMKGHTRSSSVLAVDLGETATSITLVSNGQPVLFRELRDSGMQQITHALMEGLNLSQSDCQLLLRSPGLQSSSANGSGSELRRAIFEMTRKATHKVVGELQRTFRFVTSGAKSPPKEVVLLGAGADMTGMDDLLSNALQTPTKRWTIATSGKLEAATHLFGQAAGLSAMTVAS